MIIRYYIDSFYLFVMLCSCKFQKQKIILVIKKNQSVNNRIKNTITFVRARRIRRIWRFKESLFQSVNNRIENTIRVRIF